MFCKYFFIVLSIVTVFGDENQPNLDVLIPKKNTLETRLKPPYFYKKKNSELILDTTNQESACAKRLQSQTIEDHPAENSLDHPLSESRNHQPVPSQDYTNEETNSDTKLDQSSLGNPEQEYLENQDLNNAASEDRKQDEPSALMLERPNFNSTRRFENSLNNPSDLAAELQDCLEKKLHNKKTNVVVVMPVFDKKPTDEDANDKKYLLTFIPPQSNAHIRAAEVDPGYRMQESNCDNKQIKDKKDVNTDNEGKINAESKVITETKKQLENKVQKFLRTGIAEQSAESDQNLENLDGRRRNNYEHLTLTEVVDKQDDKIKRNDQSAADSVSTEISKSENRRAGITDVRVCYACSTLNNPSCEHPSKITTVKYCTGSRNVCVKKTYQTGDTTVLVRDCAASCNDKFVLPVGVIPKHKTCHLCNDDLCNGAYSFKEQNFIILFLLSSWAFCKIIV